MSKKRKWSGYFYFLKPNKLNTILTFIVLALPILKERVPLEEGGFVIERYSPIVLIGSYVWLKELYVLILMLGFSLLVYIMASIGVALFGKFTKLSEK